MVTSAVSVEAHGTEVDVVSEKEKDWGVFVAVEAIVDATGFDVVE